MELEIYMALASELCKMELDIYMIAVSELYEMELEIYMAAASELYGSLQSKYSRCNILWPNIGDILDILGTARAPTWLCII